MIFTSILVSTMAVTPCLQPEDPIEYYEIMEQAIFNCKSVAPENIDIDIIDSLIETEKEYDVPKELRGMLLSAACAESGFNPTAKGDRKFSKDGKTPRAIGLFQMWRWWESSRYGYGIDRTDPGQAATAFMKHIVRQIEKVKKRCKYRTDKKVWVTAWVHAIRKPKEGGRCRETPRHLRILKKWHKAIMEQRKEAPAEGPGC